MTQLHKNATRNKCLQRSLDSGVRSTTVIHSNYCLVFFLLENAAQLMKMLKSNISSACTFSTQPTVNDHHFKASILVQQRQTSLHDLYDEEIIISSQHPTFFVLFRVAPPKTNQLSSSCRSRSEIDYFIYFQHVDSGSETDWWGSNSLTLETRFDLILWSVHQGGS